VNSPLLTIREVSVRYGAVQVLSGVSLDAPAGSLTAVLGPSGCGKSTLLRAVAGFIKPSSGTITVAGKPVKNPGPDRMMVFQEFDQLLPWKTARENIAFAARVTRHAMKKQLQEEISAVLELMGLNEAGNRFPHQLSGGMQQRVAIARALIAHPNIVLMDEPFASLDAITRTRLQEEVLRLLRAEGLTVVFVTHSIAEAVYLGTQIALLNTSGKLEQLYTNDFQGQRDAQGAFELEREIRQLLDRNEVDGDVRG
jgi:NitT/TauT family transport system ATP-binding protein